MVLYMIDFLIVFVAFARNEQHAAVGQHHASGLDGLAAVLNDQHIALEIGGDTFLHILQNLVGVFGAWIVGSQNHLMAVSTCNFRHHGTLERIAVATTTHHGNHFHLGLGDIADGHQHIFQRTRRVSVVDDSRALAVVA